MWNSNHRWCSGRLGAGQRSGTAERSRVLGLELMEQTKRGKDRGQRVKGRKQSGKKWEVKL